MALLFDAWCITIVLVTKPLSLAKDSCLFGLRSMFIVIQTWIELLRAAMCFHMNILWRVLIWAIAILSLPMRALTALQREKLLEMRMQDMQNELENMLWHEKKLEEKLHLAIKESRLMEDLLEELEDEHEEAIYKLEILEGELKDLKAENDQLKGVHGKAFWHGRSQDEGQIGETARNTDKFWIPLLRKGSGTKGEDQRCKDKWKDGDGSMSEMSDARKALSEACGPMHHFSEDTLNFCMKDVLEQRRHDALYRSSFSAIWSVLIGMTVWEAREPCMPLVLALFVVVLISIMSVLWFFSIIKNKHTVVVAALLSLNCFILGTVAFPLLPVFADALAPFLFRVLQKMVDWCFAFLT